MLLFLGGGMTEPVQTLLLLQAPIPLANWTSKLLFGTEYSHLQFAGSILMAVGVVVAMLPVLGEYGSHDCCGMMTEALNRMTMQLWQ